MAALKDCTTLNGLAALLGILPSGLSYILYKIDDARKYDVFTIPKKSGGVRVISAPTPRLKLLQSRLAELLNDCLTEIELVQGVDEHCAVSHGFRIDRSIITNARRHRNRRYVINLDLEEFFPSLNFGRVRGFFLKNKAFALDPRVATIIAQIACHRGTLPQGSPCSPVISNLIAHILDMHLNRMASRLGCTYTRYVDDITFSTNKRELPPELARASQDGVKAGWTPGDELVGRIHRAGFRINTRKFRVQFKDSRQDATGLIVNNKLNVPTEYYKKARSQCNLLFNTGTAYDVVGPAAKIETVTQHQLRGKLSYLYLIRGLENNYESMPRNLPYREWPAHLRLYKNLLDFVSFHNNDRMTLICEGKTDNIYILSALKALSGAYPTLIDAAAGGKPLRIKLFNYTGTTASVQELSGGTGELPRFISKYASSLRKFKTPGKLNPVIILVDNDSGADAIFGIVKQITKSPTKIDGSQELYHVIDNLYVVPTPKIGGANSAIEDFFDKALLGTVLGGKRFHRDATGFDHTKHYGKAYFAEHVVARTRGAIDFSKFTQILDRLVAVQKHYAAHVIAGTSPPLAAAAGSVP